MKHLKKYLAVLILALILLTSCGKEKSPAPAQTPSPSPTPAEEQAQNYEKVFELNPTDKLSEMNESGEGKYAGWLKERGEDTIVVTTEGEDYTYKLTERAIKVLYKLNINPGDAVVVIFTEENGERIAKDLEKVVM
ncbi:MAG: hypothetical protein GX196_02540 [Clostridiaceae bacterium]|nr:hypothetical protein [Clostridiaceae bacterium]